MISQIVVIFLKQTAKNGKFWGSAGFYFSPGENRLVSSKSHWRKFFAYFNFFAHASYSAFQVARLLQARHSSGPEIDAQYELLLEFMGLCFLIPPFCCQLCFFGREETFATFVNQYLAYYRSTEGYKN